MEFSIVWDNANGINSTKKPYHSNGGLERTWEDAFFELAIIVAFAIGIFWYMLLRRARVGRELDEFAAELHEFMERLEATDNRRYENITRALGQLEVKCLAFRQVLRRHRRAIGNRRYYSVMATLQELEEAISRRRLREMGEDASEQQRLVMTADR